MCTPMGGAGQEGTWTLTLSFALISRPRDRKCSTISTCPVRTATCRGVLSSWVGRKVELKRLGLWYLWEGSCPNSSLIFPPSPSAKSCTLEGQKCYNFPPSYPMV